MINLTFGYFFNHVWKFVWKNQHLIISIYLEFHRANVFFKGTKLTYDMNCRREVQVEITWLQTVIEFEI